MADFQNKQISEPQGISAQPVIGEKQPEVKPLTAQEVYAITQDLRQWAQLLEAKKPELETAWRQSA